jgi:hypothetical protein
MHLTHCDISDVNTVSFVYACPIVGLPATVDLLTILCSETRCNASFPVKIREAKRIADDRL